VESHEISSTTTHTQPFHFQIHWSLVGVVISYLLS
jgi:hypothetical protein